ncbi:hypothetical protein [Tahibacter caeni]|uniref:hypothetical protein n=1 Tax=Tahibacter caeni TaxID=1453545 RepID=UPI002148524A|nr:hypothetical protein [Tahibacter caeni]
MRGLLFLVLLLTACAAQAYIGPGAGVSFFGSLWAIVVGVVLSLAAVLIWPLRWALRRLRRRAPQAPAASDRDA